MGLLDDAIREHLQLKKERGASDLEIAQQESEALGPARRPPLEPEAEPGLDGTGDAAGPADAQVAEDLPPEPEEASPLDEDLPPPVAEDLPPEPVQPTQLVEPAHGGESDGVADQAEIAEPAEVPQPEVEPEFEPEPEPEPPPDLDPEPPPEPDHSAQIPSAVDEAPPADEGPLVGDEPAPGEPTGDADQGEDLLEETPEFLQDTPEHDRLWFEQKPPRDFDLD